MAQQNTLLSVYNHEQEAEMVAFYQRSYMPGT